MYIAANSQNIENEHYQMLFALLEVADRSIQQDENPHVIFSDSNNNLLTFSFKKDRSKVTNFAAILCVGECSDRKRTSYFLGYDPHSSTAADAPSHYERYEFYVDTKDILDEVKGENGEITTIPIANYFEILRQRVVDMIKGLDSHILQTMKISAVLLFLTCYHKNWKQCV